MEIQAKRQEQKSKFCENGKALFGFTFLGASQSEINDMWVDLIKAKINYVDTCLTE